MENYSEYFIPVLAFALLAAGWVVVQLVAKKAGTKNYIDNTENCCSVCEKRDTCNKT